MPTVVDGTTGVDQIQDGTVTVNKIANGAVTDAKIDTVAATKLTGDVAAARITNALNASGSAPVYACRAWVNFDGTTSPGTIRASGNVSSVTRSGTGNYTVNFTTAMPNGSYAVVDGGTRVSDVATDNFGIQTFDYQTTSVKVNSFAPAVNFVDAFRVNIAIFR